MRFAAGGVIRSLRQPSGRPTRRLRARPVAGRIDAFRLSPHQRGSPWQRRCVASCSRRPRGWSCSRSTCPRRARRGDDPREGRRRLRLGPALLRRSPPEGGHLSLRRRPRVRRRGRRARQGRRGIEVGQRVACAPDRPCGECEWCKKGETNVCPNVRFAASHGHPGCLCDYYVVDKSQVYPIPDSLGFVEASICEPMAIGLHVVENLVKPSGGETYALMGAGPAVSAS